MFSSTEREKENVRESEGENKKEEGKRETRTERKRYSIFSPDMSKVN